MSLRRTRRGASVDRVQYMSESDEIRQRLAADGYPTAPGSAADEFVVEGTDCSRAPVLVLNEAALEAYLESIGPDAVTAYGSGSDPRRSARNIVSLNITEALETRIVHRIGVGTSGWVEDTERRPDALDDVADEPGDLEWSADRGPEQG